MLVNSILILCVRICSQVCIRDRTTMKKHKHKARQNRVRTFENMVMSHFQATRPECKIESYYTAGTQKKIDCFSVQCNHCKTVFEAMG